MSKNNNSESFLYLIKKEWLILIIVILFFSGVLGAISWYLPILLLPILIVKGAVKKHVDTTTVLLTLFSVLYAIITFIYNFTENAKGNTIFYVLYPALFYILGQYLMYNWYSQKYKLLILLIFPIAIPTVLAIFTDIYTNGFINSARAIEDVGTSTTATLLGVNLSLIIASLGIAFTNKKTNKESILQIILVVSGIIGIICVVHLINRTGIIIAVITSVIILVASFRKYGLFKRISIIIVLISLVYISMPLIDGYQVADSYENREEDETYTANSAGGRTVRWMDGLEKTFTQPLGGGVYKFGKRYYAHNLWLDVSELTGIIPFLMLLTASIINLRKNYLIVRSKNTPPFLKSWLICINLGFFLSCFMEPIMEGAFTFAIMYFCFWGMTNMFYNDFVVSSQIENE